MAKVHINVVVIDISVNTPPSPFNIVYMMDIQLQRPLGVLLQGDTILYVPPSLFVMTPKTAQTV
jgi:hypothetical protein